MHYLELCNSLRVLLYDFKKLIRDGTLQKQVLNATTLSFLSTLEYKFGTICIDSKLTEKSILKLFHSKVLPLIIRSKVFLENPRDKVDEKDRSDICEIQCTSCNLKYIGQARGTIEVTCLKSMF